MCGYPTGKGRLWGRGPPEGLGLILVAGAVCWFRTWIREEDLNL